MLWLLCVTPGKKVRSYRSNNNWKLWFWLAFFCLFPPPGIMSFVLRSFIDCLPSLAALKRMKKISSLCPHCNNHETLHHILNFCSVFLNQGRYTWRHNSVLLPCSCSCLRLCLLCFRHSSSNLCWSAWSSLFLWLNYPISRPAYLSTSWSCSSLS